MTQDELVETGQRLLTLAGSQMEDLSPDMVLLVSGSGELIARAESLRSLAADLTSIAATVRMLGELTQSAPE